MRNKITQEDKDLLFADLSARLPYKTMVKCITDGNHEFDEELSVMHIINFYQFDVKPYLRSMSSMTEEERKYYIHLLNLAKSDRIVISKGGLGTSGAGDIIDYLISHHFDYRGLIPMGLALEAHKNMY